MTNKGIGMGTDAIFMIILMFLVLALIFES